MDEAFHHLEDLSDKETLERLESLFENSLPPLDSPILQDHAASAAASILEGTSSNDLGQLDSQDSEDIFGTTSTVPSTTSTAPTIVLPTQPSPIVATTTVSTSQRTSSSTTLQQTTKTVATVSSQPSLVSPPQQQSSFILSPQPVMTMATGTILTSSTPTVIQGGIQYTLQSVNPKVTNVSKANKQQPQLLPKPASGSSPMPTAISIPMSTSANAPRPVVTMATMPSPITAQAGAPSQQFVLNTGGVIAGAGAGAPLLLTGAQTNQPILIQQPGGNPILVMRPTAPTTSTILPIVSSAQGGTILLQPQTAATPTLVQPQQPQIKINTPQGTMQMQQIQTPTGPKLIAVPVGAGQMGSPQVVQQQAVVTSAAVVTSTSLQEDKKDKKAKKKLKAALQLQQNSENKSGLDLGELMKDVGLDDLDGYNNEQNTPSIVSASESSVTASSVMTSVQNAIISSAQQANQAIMTAPLTLTTSGGNQIVAQIPQQIVQPAPSNQYQLVQGPDGQFILQSTATPTILAQATIGDGLTQGIGLASGSTPLLTASGGLIGTPTPVAGLSTTNSSVIPTVGSATTTLSSSMPNIVQLSPKKTRNPPDPNRTPLYVDDRLPPGWHRKVSQRKSGASAGRYEVFIIGPTGKRFRSKNELKAFFDKTGETVLQPEHFDFTTWGANVINLPKEYANKTKSSSGSIAPAPDPTMPKLSPMTVAAAAPGPSSSTGPPVFKSQLSRETAEADAQISQLLESLQKAPTSNKLDLPSVDSEKMSELFNSLTNEDSSSSPPPTLVKTMNSETKNNSKPIPMTSGTSGFQASFLNSIATPTPSDKSKVGNSETLPISGAGTQRRALQNLPQNTKLVRGPNGQYSLQKVQTIELTLEQQNSLRVVQAKIQEIERQPTKSVKEENELAQLHVKQQQILAAGRPVNTQNVTEQPPVSKSIPVPNVTVTKSTPIRYTHTVGNQVISLPPASNAGTTTTTTSSASSTTSSTTPTVVHPVGSAAATAAAITQLTDEQKRIVFEFKQKMALLPPEQQPAFISQHKGALLKQLNFQPTQLQLLRNNQIQLQLGASRPTPSSGGSSSRIIPAPQVPVKAPRPLPVGAGTIRQPDEAASNASSSSTAKDNTGQGAKQKNIAWIENQIKKDQHEAVNAKYKLPFKSKDDAIKRLLRYHVFYELDSSPEEMVKAEDKFEEKSGEALDKYRSMLDRYHYLLTQESKRLISSSEEVMLARLWDTEERQLFAREKEEVEAGNLIDVPLLEGDKKQEYSNYVNALKPAPPPTQFKDEPIDVKPEPPLLLPEIENLKKRKRSGSSLGSMDSINEDKIGLKFARSESGNWVKSQYENQQQSSLFQDPDDDSDDEFTLKDVDTERAVGTILDAASSNDEDDDDDVDDVFPMGNDEDVVAAAFGTSADSVQNAINSILDTLPQGDRIETPDINNITGLFDSIDDETATERDPVTEAAVNSIPQF